METDQGEDELVAEMDNEDSNINVNKELANEQEAKEENKTRLKESHLVQIKASNAEIQRRITAFIERKQSEVDENNRQEFCNVHPSVEDEEDSCARCRAIFVPRGDSKSHIKVSRVVNMYGPQTQILSSNRVTSPQKVHIKQEPQSTDGVEERLANMESHLNLRALSKVDVYKRLKDLEERILFLESLSPEYFSAGPPNLKRKRESSRSTTNGEEDKMSLSEIDLRIASLRESLLKKSIPSAF